MLVLSVSEGSIKSSLHSSSKNPKGGNEAKDLKLSLPLADESDDTEIRSSAWLEHYTDNVGVSSSNLLGSTKANGC